MDNSEMCSIHGWPLYRQCGGSGDSSGNDKSYSNGYWSSTKTLSSSVGHAVVDLYSGYAYGSGYDDDYLLQVACMRR